MKKFEEPAIEVVSLAVEAITDEIPGATMGGEASTEMGI